MSLKKDIISFNFYPFYGNLHLYFLFITLMGTSNLIQSKESLANKIKVLSKKNSSLASRIFFAFIK